MIRLLPALWLLAACTSPSSDGAASAPAGAPPASPPVAAAPGEPVREPAFDASQWMADVRAAETRAQRVALSDRLLDAVDWRTACGEDDPTAPGRGLVQLHGAGPRTLAEITCQTGAYQSVFALVDAAVGRPARLVRSLTVTSEGQPTENETATFLGIVSAGPQEAFDVVTKSAGHGGCGTHVVYQLRPDAAAEIVEVRAHADCNEPLAPDEWPVTYRADP